MEDREDGTEDIDELARELQDTDGMFSNTATIIPIGFFLFGTVFRELFQ